MYDGAMEQQQPLERTKASVSQQQTQQQQQQKQQQGTKRARKRLRDSCNSCALSKVKCSRDQPSCERCLDRGIYCAYSPSRRTGKRRATTSLFLPSAAPQSRLSMGPETQTDENFSFGIEFSEFEESRNLNPQLLMDPNNDGGLKTPALSDYSNMPWNDTLFAAIIDNVAAQESRADLYTSRFPGSESEIRTLQEASYTMFTSGAHGNKSSIGSAGSSDGSGLSEPYETDLIQIHPSQTQPTNQLQTQKAQHQEVSSLPADFFESHFDILSQNPHPITSVQSTQPDLQKCPSLSNRQFANPCSTTSSMPKDCMTIALDALQSLHRPQPTCTIASNDDNPTHLTPTLETDDVLAKNKEIMDAVATTFKCPCSLDTQLALILTCIGFKIIAWYSAIARSDDENDSCSAANVNASAGAGEGEKGCERKVAAERVNDMPISIGKYHFESHDKVRMRAQIALGELHRVVRLIEQLGQSFEGVGAAISAEPAPGAAGFGVMGASGAGPKDEDGDEEQMDRDSGVQTSTLIGPVLVAFLRERVRTARSETIGILKKSQQIP